MRAVILAGGKGTRLKPYTTVLPKPLLPVGDKPIVEILLGQLKRAGVKHVTMAVGHKADLFPTVLGNGHRWGLKLDYVRERRPLGTAAPLRNIPGLKKTFLVLNGDILTDLDMKVLRAFHRKAKSIATIATFRRRVPVDFGVLESDRDHLITTYVEKPTLSYRVSMGIYVFEPEALDYIPRRGHFDFPDLINRLLERGLPVASFPFKGHWLDIGRPDDFERAADELKRHPTRYR